MALYYSLLFPKNWDDPLSKEGLDDIYKAKYAALRKQISDGLAKVRPGFFDGIPDPDPDGARSGPSPGQWSSSGLRSASPL
jgi:hypothetical protein